MYRGPEQSPNNKVILALDDAHHQHGRALITRTTLARDVGPHVHAVSISMQSAQRVGLRDTLAKYRQWGVDRIMIDETFGVQDIDMMTDIISQHHAVRYITVDGTMGMRAMHRLVTARNRLQPHQNTRLIATTYLPEIPEQDIERTYRQTVPELVANLTEQAHDAGMDGVYCSARQQPNCAPGFLWVASGVRIEQIPDDDKFQVATLDEIRSMGQRPDRYVIGRAVTRFDDYAEQIEAIQTVIDHLATFETDRQPQLS